MSSISIQEFEREYLKALKNESAVVFAGAGLSRASGYVNWKDLLREFAEDISLKVEKEDDLVSLAQYYYNQRGGNRNTISNKIIEEFTKETRQNKNLEILTSLPIEKYWTTNYDSLIEDTLINYANKKVDVKRTVENLANTLPGRDVIVYKMHGDVTQPHNAVIIKDDYESYNEKRQLFTTSLQGDLVSKTFLFIGFSFEDPNLIYILSRIRILLGEEHNRMHYCFIKEVQESEYEEHEDFIYDKTKQELRIQDLQRYGISAVLVKEFSEITESLRRIQFKHNLNSILISGSAEIYGDMGEDNAGQFVYSLSNQLVKRNFKIVTGYGKGIGTYVVSGVLEEVYEHKYGHVSTYLTPRPFPFIHKGETDIQEIARSYRDTIINECGVAIFMFGNKIDKVTGENVNASGVYQEFKIADEKGKVIIPIGSTGFMAKEILEEVQNDLVKYWYLKDSLDVLMNELDPVKVFVEISKIITKVKGA